MLLQLNARQRCCVFLGMISSAQMMSLSWSLHILAHVLAPHLHEGNEDLSCVWKASLASGNKPCCDVM